MLRGFREISVSSEFLTAESWWIWASFTFIPKKRDVGSLAPAIGTALHWRTGVLSVHYHYPSSASCFIFRVCTWSIVCFLDSPCANLYFFFLISNSSPCWSAVSGINPKYTSSPSVASVRHEIKEIVTFLFCYCSWIDNAYLYHDSLFYSIPFNHIKWWSGLPYLRLLLLSSYMNRMQRCIMTMNLVDHRLGSCSKDVPLKKSKPSARPVNYMNSKWLFIFNNDIYRTSVQLFNGTWIPRRAGLTYTIHINKA